MLGDRVSPEGIRKIERRLVSDNPLVQRAAIEVLRRMHAKGIALSRLSRPPARRVLMWLSPSG